MAKASDNVFPRLLISEGGSTATPASGNVTVYAKADGLLYSKDDAGTETLVSGGGGAGSFTAFADYTPTWTNVTVGNGTLVARWAQVGSGAGSLVKVQIQLTFGNSSSLSGDIVVSLPATAATRATNFPLGTGLLFDASSSGSYSAQVVQGSTTTAKIRPQLSNGTYVTHTTASSTVPFGSAFTTSDVIMAEFEYEAG